ncbi:MAG: hypothetical protein EBV06_12330 [Planctomycetia bacterium]|nr:hypothetical protein [Planctomycetia bacterium]
MRHLFAVSLALVAGVTAGCLPDVRQPTAPLESSLHRSREIERDLIFIDSAIIERPANDDFCNRELWDSCNEQSIGLERAALLEENGLRVARISAPLPSRLQVLLNSRRNTIGPRRQRARPDQSVSVAVGPRRPKMVLSLRGSDSRDLDLTDAQAHIEVTPSLDEDRLQLRITPQIRHGQPRARPRVEETPDGPLRWALDTREPVESLDEFTLDLPMEPGEYLLIGSRGNGPRTVGPAIFAYQGDGVPVQQLLIIRALPVGQGNNADDVDQRTAPLALQAGYSSARASRR